MEVTLPCGADPNEVWEGITRPPTDHERDCPSCSSVRREARRASALRVDVVRPAADRPPIDLDALASARRSGRRDLSPRHRVRRDQDGVVEVREAVLEAIIGATLRESEDVVLRDVRFSVPGSPLAVRLDVEVAGGVPIAERTAWARQRVADTLEHQLGGRPDRVDIVVGDVHV